MKIEQSTMTASRSYGAAGSYPPALFRGRIAAVVHPDQNATKQTLVDLDMYDLLPPLYMVPIVASKINSISGEQSTPEVGDIVLVGFISGNMRDPVVIGYLPVQSNEVQASSAEAPHYRKIQNGTIETIKKDGSREIYVEKDEIVTIKGHGTVVIQEGNLSIDVQTGTATINVAGNTTIHSDGDIVASAAGGTTVSGGTINIASDSGVVSIESAAALDITSTGNATISSGGTCVITSTGVTNVTGANVTVTATGTATVQGSTGSISL